MPSYDEATEGDSNDESNQPVVMTPERLAELERIAHETGLDEIAFELLAEVRRLQATCDYLGEHASWCVDEMNKANKRSALDQAVLDAAEHADAWRKQSTAGDLTEWHRRQDKLRTAVQARRAARGDGQ